MLGAVIGDIAGAAYEWNNVKTNLVRKTDYKQALQNR